ncbi:hypothetical protein AC579_6462 [Pseudocercospora musae]|uniref:Uncharacterized protein n=1 Tax=Pseudocercospora musae TaxID=113226 RepID=A0A139IK07_9PEZI|nr:hypothetical protein AC579_6462 [Pseudocercospora musae]
MDEKKKTEVLHCPVDDDRYYVGSQRLRLKEPQHNPTTSTFLFSDVCLRGRSVSTTRGLGRTPTKGCQFFAVGP